MSRRAERRRNRSRRRLLAGALAVLALAGGSWWWLENRSEAGAAAALATAREHLQRHEPARAIPLLRAVVQGQPKDGAARELLGLALLEAGDSGGALKELRRALTLGHDTPANRLALARAHLLRGEFDEALGRLAAIRDDTSPAWNLLSAEVRSARGAHADALPFYDQALAQDASLLGAYLGKARSQMALGALDDAQATLARALERHVEGPDLWLLQGQLGLAQRRHDDARAAFARVLAKTPAHELALLGTAAAELGQLRYEAATATLDQLTDNAQGGPRALYLRAMIASGRRQPQVALNLLRRVLSAAPEHRESLRQAARLHFELGAYGDAEHLLRRLLKLDADDPSALRMLEAVQLAAGHFDPAAYDLDALEGAQTQDPQMLAMLGAALLRTGQIAASERALGKALEKGPESVAVERQLLFSRLAAGKFDAVLEAVPDLEAHGDQSTAPAMLRVAAQLGRHDVAAARDAAQAMIDRHPGDPYAYNILGFVQEAAGARNDARRTYLRALEIEPGFDGALLNLARLDMADDRFDTAAARFQAVLDAHPDHPQALDGLATLALHDKQPARAAELWQQARGANPHALRPRLLLARQAREQGQVQESVDYAREAWQLAPYAPGVQLQYCLSLLAAQRNDDALPLASALARRFPEDGKLARLLAIALARNGDASGLREVLGRMAAAAPDNVDARVALGRLALQQGRTDDAATLASALLEHAQGEAAGRELRGDVALQRQDAAAAADEYAQAFKLQPGRELLLKLDAAERGAGRPGERLVTWLHEHPDDLQVRSVHAGRLQTAGDDAAAIAEFERVLAAAPDSAVVRNNLAWLYRRTGDGRALDMARKAYELAPQRAEIADTYGWILLEQGRHEQALDVLEQALRQAPTNPDIRYHRASALERLGRDEDALRELEDLLREPTDFESRAEAEQLRYELKS